MSVNGLNVYDNTLNNFFSGFSLKLINSMLLAYPKSPITK